MRYIPITWEMAISDRRGEYPFFLVVKIERKYCNHELLYQLHLVKVRDQFICYLHNVFRAKMATIDMSVLHQFFPIHF